MNTCENCNTSFEPKQPHQRFCSTQCRTEAHYKRKFAVKEPVLGTNNGHRAEYMEDEEKRLKTALNGSYGIFDRLLQERESRMEDKIKLAQAEMKIQYLEQKLKDEESSSMDTDKLIAAFTALFNVQKP